MEVETWKTTATQFAPTEKKRNEFWVGPRIKRRAGLNAALPDALFNDNDPVRVATREQTWHRRAAELSENGCTVAEIAALLDRSRSAVSNALRQPTTRARMINNMRQDTISEFRSLLEAEVVPNLEVVKAIRDNERAKPADRLAAARELWDRFLGRPNQPITASQTVDPSKLTDQQILEQLASSGAVSAGATPTPEDQAKPDVVG